MGPSGTNVGVESNGVSATAALAFLPPDPETAAQCGNSLDDDSDGIADDGCDPDDDNDGVYDLDEGPCGGATPSYLRPGRVDGAFAVVATACRALLPMTRVS